MDTQKYTVVIGPSLSTQKEEQWEIERRKQEQKEFLKSQGIDEDQWLIEMGLKIVPEPNKIEVFLGDSVLFRKIKYMVELGCSVERDKRHPIMEDEELDEIRNLFR